MITLKNPYDSWLTRNSKWLLSKPTEITLANGPNTGNRPQMHPTGTYETYIMLFCHWDLSQHKKWMPPSPNWDGLHYDVIFKMAASEVKLRFSDITRHLG